MMNLWVISMSISELGINLSSDKIIPYAEKTIDDNSVDLENDPIISEQVDASGTGGVVMKAVEPSTVQKIGDFLSDVQNNLAHNDSFSLLHNLWKTTFNPKQAVPVYENDKFMGVREETDDEKAQRIVSDKKIAKEVYGLDDSSAAAITAKIASVFVDPTTYLPLGSSYKTIAGTMGAYTGIDVAAYEAANEGRINPADVAVATAFGTVLGPAFKYVGEKAVSLYKEWRIKGASHESAVEETLKALPPPEEILPTVSPKQEYLPSPETLKLLPKPEVKGLPAPQKKLPSPKESTAPRYIGRAGKEEGAPKDYQVKIVKDVRYKSDGDILRESSDPNSPIAIASARIAKEQKEGVDSLQKFAKQGGNINVNLLSHVATTAIGATIGGKEDGIEGMAVGGLIGLSAPLASRYLIKSIGKISEWANKDFTTKRAFTHLYSAPDSMMKGFGESGRKMASDIRQMYENIDLKVAEKLSDFSSNFSHISKESMRNVQRLLSHSSKAGTKEEILAAKQIRREFNQALDDAADAHILSREAVAKLKKKASEKGYFPRIYDTDYLSTSKGKEAWIAAWSKTSYSKEGLIDAVSSILGEKKVIEKFVESATKMRGGGYQMSESQALELLKLMRNRINHARSTHLEKERKLHPSTEAIIEPFLIKDPSAAIARYFHDVYRRIESAKIFDGVNEAGEYVQDLHADKLIKSVRGEYGSDAADLLSNTYYTAVNDSSSSVIKAAMKLNDAERAGLQAFASFETGSKLSLAAPLNMLQATVNGMTKLLADTANPFKSVKVFGKAFIQSLGKEGKTFSDRSGAAIETTLMEVANEATRIGSFGTNVLKYTGFLAAERIQRRLAANIGRVYAEDLIEKWAKVRFNHQNSGVSKGLQRQADKVARQMKELGIPLSREANDTDMYRAGLRFSNEVNFRNTADKMPLWAQTPYGRMATKFKSFAFNQTKFVKNSIIKPLLKGNPMPALWYSSAAAGMGMGVDEFRRMVKGDDREFSMTERYLRGITMIGGIGLMQDIISNVARDPGRAALSLAGPAFSDAVKLSSGAIKSVEDQDPSKMLKSVLDMFVFPGKGYIIDEIANEGRERGGRGGR